MLGSYCSDDTNGLKRYLICIMFPMRSIFQQYCEWSNSGETKFHFNEPIWCSSRSAKLNEAALTLRKWCLYCKLDDMNIRDHIFYLSSNYDRTNLEHIYLVLCLLGCCWWLWDVCGFTGISLLIVKSLMMMTTGKFLASQMCHLRASLKKKHQFAIHSSSSTNVGSSPIGHKSFKIQLENLIWYKKNMLLHKWIRYGNTHHAVPSCTWAKCIMEHF